MVNELINRQIVACREQGAAPEDIAAELGINVATVNLVLSAHGLGDRDITDEQLVLLRQNAFELAMQKSDLSVSSRMTQYLIDRDKPRQEQHQTPLIVINNAIQSANEKLAELSKEYSNVVPLQAS